MSNTEKAEKLFQGQHEGEEIEMVFHQHPLVMRKALIVGLFVIMFAVLPLAFEQIYLYEWLPPILLNIMWVAVIGVFAAWFYSWIGWYYTVYIVTDTRIMEIKQKGFFNRKIEEWQLDNISSVNYHVNGFQAVLFGYGDITARTYVGDLVMRTIHKPAEIHEQLVDAVKRAGGSTQLPN